MCILFSTVMVIFAIIGVYAISCGLEDWEEKEKRTRAFVTGGVLIIIAIAAIVCNINFNWFDLK